LREKILITYEFDYPEDVERIARVVGLTSLKEAELLWLKYSDSMAAGWLVLPESDDELLLILKGYDES
jgi:hypothetical protein